MRGKQMSRAGFERALRSAVIRGDLFPDDKGAVSRGLIASELLELLHAGEDASRVAHAWNTALEPWPRVTYWVAGVRLFSTKRRPIVIVT